MLQTPLETGKMAGPIAHQTIRVLIVEKHGAVRRALCNRLGATKHLDIIAAVDEPVAAFPYLEKAAVAAEEGTTATIVLLGLQNATDEELFLTLDKVRQMVSMSATVVALAPYADEIERLLLNQAGVSRYLLKYIDSNSLIREIEAAAQTHPYRLAGN
jgi:DNA-binding NarL/FixJ family response regulator